MLEWAAIDWCLKPRGEYVFIEANPSQNLALSIPEQKALNQKDGS